MSPLCLVPCWCFLSRICHGQQRIPSLAGTKQVDWADRLSTMLLVSAHLKGNFCYLLQAHWGSDLLCLAHYCYRACHIIVPTHRIGTPEQIHCSSKKCMTDRVQLDHITKLLFSLLVQDSHHRLLWDRPNFILEDELIYLCFLTVALGRSGVRICHYLVK